VDDQVKLRGFRVEPGEIEAALAAHPAVAAAAVTVAGGARLAAYAVLHDGAEVTPAELRAHLAARLPEHMVPQSITLLSALPLSPSGKVDRRALPAPDFAAAAEAYVPPRTPTEELVASVWAELLGIDRAGAHDGFFALGGHSLLGTRVVSRLRERLGVEVPLGTLFEAPRLDAFAARVDDLVRAQLGVRVPPIRRTEGDTAPLSFAQERLWFIDRLAPGGAAYTMSPVLHMRGPVNMDAMRRALAEVVRRHEPLRTVFPEVDDTPVQRIHPAAAVDLPVEDLASEEDLSRRVTEWAAQPFDLRTGPLFRARLLRLPEDDYVLLLGMHHIVSDGWSNGILLRELYALYDAFAAGRPSALAPLPARYADYAAWQREWLSGEELQRQVAFWREHLAGAPALLELPLDHPRPAVQSYRGLATRFVIGADVATGLRELARGEGSTLFMALLGAFSVLLSRWSGQDDVVIGMPIAGRTSLEVEELIGLFVNTLALRTELGGDPSFRALLARVRASTLDAYAHQELPFEKLVEELQPERSLSHAPVFQAMFALQNTPNAPTASDAGLAAAPVAREGAQAKVDLQLNMVEGYAGELFASLTYAADLFAPETMDRMAGQLGTLLASIVAAPDAPVASLPILDEGERARLLADFAGAPAEHADVPAQALFEAQAERTPHAAALLLGDARMTYAELDARANRLAHLLRARGIGAERTVAVLMEPSMERVVALLGILKAGAAYVPVDPAYPADRVAYMLHDSAAALVLAQGRWMDAVPGGVEALALDAPGALDGQPADRPESIESMDGLAYVIYTSGSTGRPKGVLVRHGSLANLLAATREAFGVRAGDVMPALASHAFDISLFETLLPLTSGAAVRLVARERVMDVPALVDEVADCTLLHAVPALMRQIAHAERGAPRLKHLRRVFVGGDLVPAALLAEMREALPSAEAHVLYGPTEATILASIHPVPADGAVEGHPIGRPLANVRLYVCDAGGNLQPVGVAGELWIGGSGVARGYRGRAALTAEQFVPDAFGAAGGRLYRTGDRARWRADGTLEFLGRIDEQVKIRGFRIEPGEVEAVLRGHDGVRECAVVAREDVPGDRRLVAYVAGDADADALRSHLREHLPDYMIPAAFVSLDALPLTPNGKVDRRALPAPDFSAEAYVAPRTPTEEVVAEIWRELLRVDRVGVRDGFFALGGHSLMATRVISRLRERLDAEVPLAALFEAPRLDGFAARVDDVVRGGAGVRLTPMRHVEAGTAPLSFAQERLWFIDRLEPGTTAYNMSPVLRMRGPVNLDAMRRALAEVVRRHEPLRTTFPEVDGAPVQHIHPAGPFDLPVEELASEDELPRRVGEWSAEPFDLRSGPVFRARLLRLPDDDYALLLAMHHIVSDGWSNGILLRELFTLYDAFSAGRPSPLPPLAARYAEYATWQREWLSGEELARQVAFWREHLAGAPALLELPLDSPRPAVQSYRGLATRFVIDAQVAEGLRTLAREEGGTLFMALLGAFSVLLSRWSGQDDVVIGTPIAGRTSLEVEDLIGLFVNTLALRTELGGDPSFRALLAQVRGSTLDAYAHQDLPFEKLVEELQPERSLSHAPVFQALFALQNTPDGPAPSDAGLAAAPVARESAQAKVDLQLNVVEGWDGALYASLVYASDLFAPETMERMAGQLWTLLGAIVATPDAPVSTLPLLEDEERAQLLADFAGPAAAYPDVPLHALFEAQAQRTPNAVALAFGDARMTYAELDARANQLAHLLRARGIGAERTVAVLMERSMEMVIALYGILKAGAAYVPVDPEYPADRVSYMLQDSAAALVLTQGRWMDTVPADADALALDAPGALDGQPDYRPESIDSTDRLAYVIYTSGSTGRPKGAMNAHRGVVNRILWMQDAFGLSAEDAVLQKTPFSFDVSVWEFFWPLAVGARLVIAAPGAHRDPAALTELIDRERITTLHFVPSMLRAWLDGGDASRCTSLRKVMSSGEALPADIVERFYEALPSAELHNLYGPTEAAVDVTHWPCTPHPAHGVVPIGAPVANTRMYVLDGRGAPCPIGVPGELWIAGVQVGRGYWRRPGLTAERFVADPFAAMPGARMYRTGDRARWREESAEVRECVSAEVSPASTDSRTDALTHSRTAVLEYLGRTDFQVKVRGFRIEPGEIEAALKQHPSVADAVVVALGEDRDARLVAYLTAREGEAVPADAELRERLAASMPEYMIPSAFVPLDEIPLTPSGKVDRRALPEPDAPAAGGYVVPRDVTELEVARIWGEALGVPRVGAADDFFRMGGHSLLALRMMARIRERFGRELPLATLFRHPTVAAFAEALRREGADADDGRLLVTLNAGGALPPLFMFPPAGGTVTHYADLARHLGPEQPFLALHAPGLTGDEAPLESVEAMAVRYVEEIRAAQPHGPYWLGGWSAGGTTAFEAARQLRAAGEEVALLAIVDSPAPDGQQERTPPDRVRLLRLFAGAIATEDEALLDALEEELRALPEEERLAGLSRWIARHGGQVMDAELERVGLSVAVFAATARAVYDYRNPPPLDVPMALFVASEGKAEEKMGPDALPDRWRPFAAAGLTVHTVPGAHVHLPLDPAAETLAAQLREVMEAVRSG
jgi:amino acid adenylation domain-containing protein